MDIHHLKVFASVYRQKSFSRASEELRLSQPTISEHVKSLEEALGVRLFDRLGRSISPTREASLLYPRALEVIEKLEGIREAIEQAADIPRGELLLGASTIPGTYIIPHAAAAFRSLHPAVSFKVMIEDSGRIARMVAGDELLVGFVGARMLERGVDYKPFVRDDLLLVGRKGFHDKSVISIEEFKKLPFVLREEGSGTRKTLEQHLREKDITVAGLNVVATLGSTASVKEAVKAGIGASVMSRMAVKEEIKKGTLVELKIKGLKMVRDFYVIARRGKTLPPTYRLFLEYLMSRPHVRQNP